MLNTGSYLFRRKLYNIIIIWKPATVIHDMKIKTKFASIQRHATQWNQTSVYVDKKANTDNSELENQISYFFKKISIL